MRFLPVNRSTILVELADLDETLALQASLTLQPVVGIEESLPAAQTLMLRFDPERLSVEALTDALSRRELNVGRRPAGPWVEIPIRYDGEDLAEVAQLAGLSVDELIHRHQHSEFSVGFCGFAPGFAYLVGGDPALYVARRQTPRARVPAGSVAIGGVYCGVYPRPSPGGWHLIGSTSMSMWDLARDPPALLRPGSRVRFIEQTASSAATPERSAARVRTDTPGDGPRERDAQLTIIATTLPVLVQDLGRPGHAHIGVSPSGAVDRVALQSANRAVDNPSELACLEIAFGGLTIQCSGETRIALAGATVPITVRRSSGELVSGALNQPIDLGPGDCVQLGYPQRGVRSYLAARGGFETERVLGSASRDTLAAIGPEPLGKGAVLRVQSPAARSSRMDFFGSVADRPVEVRTLPAADEIVELDVVLGPRTDWFSEDSVAVLLNQAWRVTPQSNRVGLRLQGDTSLARGVTRELPSEGVTHGAIQIPHDGQPVLLLTDHPVTGGYPVIAVVAEHHLDLAGQIPPGARIRFRATARFAPIAAHPVKVGSA